MRVNVTIKNSVHKLFDSACAKEIQVNELKKLILLKFNTKKCNQILVFRGRVLGDHDKIEKDRDGYVTNIYLVERKQTYRNSEISSYLQTKLLIYAQRIDCFSNDQYNKYLNRIKAILSNKILKGSSRIFPHVRDIITMVHIKISSIDMFAKSSEFSRSIINDNHMKIMDNFQYSYRVDSIIAKRIGDVLHDTFDLDDIRFESSNEIGKTSITGNHHTSSDHGDEDEEYDSQFENKSNLDGLSSFESLMEVELKERYANQMSKLKEMGFDDEEKILQVLNETDGNVQIAASILRGGTF